MNKSLLFLGALFCIEVILQPLKAFGNESPEPTLTISNAGSTKTYSAANLLKMKSLRSINIPVDHAYQDKPRRYLHAVLVSEIFKGISIDSQSSVTFRCLDGFAAPIDILKILNTDRAKSIAYIAFETKDDPWPPIKKAGGPSAGPFYLVWENPKKSNIKIEEWPYQLSGFEVSEKSVAELYPGAHPGKETASDSPIGKGYSQFMKNCFACHKMNGDGASEIGPDLNLPESAADYLKREYFLKFVRSPKSLRNWSGSKMPGFDKTQLSDEELAQIWLYLGYMSKRKK